MTVTLRGHRAWKLGRDEVRRQWKGHGSREREAVLHRTGRWAHAGCSKDRAMVEKSTQRSKDRRAAMVKQVNHFHVHSWKRMITSAHGSQAP